MNHQTTRPQTATEILKTAASTLGERGKQYDPAGKQERSMTAIVAAFNAIYPSNLLTVHMGWQFMSLVKMVRGATKPHADSALDQVAYAALAAECVAECLHQPVPTDAQAMAAAFSKHKEPRLTPYQKEQPATTAQTTEHYVVLGDLALLEAQSNYIMSRVREGATVKIMSDATARRLHLEEELEEEPKLSMPTEAGYARVPIEPKRPTPPSTPALATEVARLQAIIATQDSRLHNVQLAHKDQVAELVAAQDKLRERELLDIETINDLRAELAMRNDAVRGLCELRTKLNAELADKNALLKDIEIERNNWQNCLERSESKFEDAVATAIYRDKRNAELCAELETQRVKCISQSSRISELQTLVDNLRSLLAQATKEAPCAHNTDEPKAAPRPEYVDPFDQYGDMRSPMHRLVGDRDPARGGLAYPAGKDAPTPL